MICVDCHLRSPCHVLTIRERCPRPSRPLDRRPPRYPTGDVSRSLRRTAEKKWKNSAVLRIFLSADDPTSGMFHGLSSGRVALRSEALRRVPATPFRCGPPRYGCRPGEKAQPTTAICFEMQGEFEKMRRGANCNQAKSGQFSITYVAALSH
jgi:hypothetical protein